MITVTISVPDAVVQTLKWSTKLEKLKPGFKEWIIDGEEVMQVQNLIEHKLTEALAPEHLEVVNESENHNVPSGSESHFKVTMVSEAFAGENLIKRHRKVYQLLADELQAGVHALALHLYTLDEWRNKNGQSPLSPPCMGGEKGHAQ